MRRRNLLAAIGTLVGGTGAALGTGAFSTVSAERSFEVSTTEDQSALLALERGEGGEASNVVSNNTSSPEVLKFDFSDKLNNEALTAFDGILRVTNTSENEIDVTKLIFRPEDSGGGEVSDVLSVYTTGGSGPDEDPIDDQFDDSTDDNILTDDDDDFGGSKSKLTPGDAVEVGFLFDTTDNSSVSDIENIVITAETSESGAETQS